jgi:hypothetical protein
MASMAISALNGPLSRRNLRQVLRWFTERGPALGLPVVRIKNRFALAREDVPDGYRDLKCVPRTRSSSQRLTHDEIFATCCTV